MPTDRGPVAKATGPLPIWAPSRRFSVATWSAVATAAVFVIFIVLLNAGAIQDKESAARVDVLFQSLLLVSAGVAAAAASYANHGRPRWGWALLAGAVLSLIPATVAYIQSEITGDATWTTSPLIQATYIACLPSAMAGIVLLSPRWRAASMMRSLLDGAILAGAVLSIGWILFLGDMYRAAPGSDLERSMLISFPLLDVFLVTLAFAVAVRTRPKDRPALLLLLGGLTIFAATDATFAFLTVSG
ncbi:MAG TPA: hypothetical protein VI818_01415, partial [Candidatus Thermoplasmatota archaeon]|nr:hypothetical protein [Candidatus Thermoplasmatota archaeon]